MSEESSKAEHDAIAAAMGFGPEPPRELTNADRAHEAHGQARAALRNAETAARRNDHAGAKRWADTAQRMADTAAQLATMPMPLKSPEEEQAVRQELQERLAKFCTDDAALNQWRLRLEIWKEMAAEAERTGTTPPLPMPPRPPHWADTLPEDVRRRVIGEDV